MWTPTTRQQHSRPVTRYQTDLTDAEWRVIVPHLPKPCATGRPQMVPFDIRVGPAATPYTEHHRQHPFGQASVAESWVKLPPEKTGLYANQYGGV
jgi:hypothetical protein